MIRPLCNVGIVIIYHNIILSWSLSLTIGGAPGAGHVQYNCPLSDTHKRTHIDHRKAESSRQQQQQFKIIL